MSPSSYFPAPSPTVHPFLSTPTDSAPRYGAQASPPPPRPHSLHVVVGPGAILAVVPGTVVPGMIVPGMIVPGTAAEVEQRGDLGPGQVPPASRLEVAQLHRPD